MTSNRKRKAAKKSKGLEEQSDASQVTGNLFSQILLGITKKPNILHEFNFISNLHLID
jgi:hypothetical protein